ncbi:MAG TPA: carbohydrate-binding family 9-like protein [Tepidisphaeraceae bacterium]|nr:carbohydrate-binding family 9-like protein [Tepidisphaeraceae bacterium]
MKTYTVKSVPPGLLDEFNWDGSVWGAAEVANIDQFHARSSDHHPRTRVRVMHDGRSIFLKFKVDDRYVLSRATEYGGRVWEDSCVEFFVQPVAGKGYFNFEINAGGTLLVRYIEDPTRLPDGSGLAKQTPVSPELAERVSISRSLPRTVWPEMVEPTKWWIGCLIPLPVLEAYAGDLGNLSGQRWRANFYKCADASSHPHWASWSPIGEELNIHQPRYFGEVMFE